MVDKETGIVYPEELLKKFEEVKADFPPECHETVREYMMRFHGLPFGLENASPEYIINSLKHGIERGDGLIDDGPYDEDQDD